MRFMKQFLEINLKDIEINQINGVLLVVNLIYLIISFVFKKHFFDVSGYRILIYANIIISLLVLSIRNYNNNTIDKNMIYITLVYFAFTIMFTVYIFFILGRLLV